MLAKGEHTQPNSPLCAAASDVVTAILVRFEWHGDGQDQEPARSPIPPTLRCDRSVQTAEARNLKMRNTLATYAVLGTERLPPTS